MAFIQDKGKLGRKTTFFSNTNYCSKITQSEMFIIPDKSSDHEETDTKLVALIRKASIQQEKTVMVRLPSRDIDILVLPSRDIGILVFFLLHQFENYYTYR